MVYPEQGFCGQFVKHAPLSLLYASTELVKQGEEVIIIDNRLSHGNWRSELDNVLTKDVLAVGISVMSGEPIKNAVEVGRFVKSNFPQILVIWGGPHATFYPEGILEQEWSCDYVISGYGSKSLANLVGCIKRKEMPQKVRGVSFRNGPEICRVPPEDTFELINYWEIPYHLVEDFSVYGQLGQNKIIFSMYSVLGCPYNCAFCSSPALYAKLKKRWVPLEVNSVVNHIEYVVQNYGADYIYFIDDDSFVNLKHVETLIDEINRRNIKIGLGFRGARINEIKRMSDAFLEKLADAGTDALHIGAESGSDRILKLVRKDCVSQDIVNINKKLARHPRILAAYNFIVGLPTETLEDLKETRDLMMRLVADNPGCVIFPPNKFRPTPGTELFELSKKEWGYVPPTTMEEWQNVAVEGDFSSPWCTKEMKKFCNLLLIGSYFVDGKTNKVKDGKSWLYRLYHFINIVYGPIVRFRFKHGIYQWLAEYYLYQFMTKWMNRNSTISGKI